MIRIYWYCHEMTDADEEFVANSLNELAQNLRREPIKLNVSIKALRDEPDLLKKAIAILNKFTGQSYTFKKCDTEISETFTRETHIEKLLVYCRPNSKIAKAARKEKPSALWGASLGFFSAVYKPYDKSTIWHEALHLLGLDDCYDEKNPRIRKCKCETCLMQYELPQGVDEKWPSPLCDNLCRKNIKQLQGRAKKVE